MQPTDAITITAATERLAPLAVRQETWLKAKAAKGHPVSPEAEARICTHAAAPMLAMHAVPLCEIVAANAGRARKIAIAKGLPLGPAPIQVSFEPPRATHGTGEGTGAACTSLTGSRATNLAALRALLSGAIFGKGGAA